MNYSNSKQINFQREIYFYGFLRYKKTVFNTWNLFYSILYTDGSLVLYYPCQRKLKKTYLSISLRDYSRVETHNSKYANHCFILVPYISSCDIIKLSAPSENDRNVWILKCTELRQKFQMMSFDYIIDPHADDEAHYIDLSENKNLQEQNHDNVSESFVYDLISLDIDSSSKIFQSKSDNSINPNAFENNLLSLDNESISSVNSKDYYQSANFYGSRSQSIEILKSKGFNGSYLIRDDEESPTKVLDVWDEFCILSYDLIFDNNRIRLRDDDKLFDNITYLLYFYSFNKLPNSCLHLEIPFSLLD